MASAGAWLGVSVTWDEARCPSLAPEHMCGRSWTLASLVGWVSPPHFGGPRGIWGSLGMPLGGRRCPGGSGGS